MNNPNALCTIGMLSALLENGSRDYSDLISPFILAATPEISEQPIELSQIQSTLKSQYGFEDIPLDFIRGTLQRYTKTGGYFRRKNGRYYVQTAYDKSELIRRQTQTREKIDFVLQKMQQYFISHYANKELPFEELLIMLENFFISCGFDMLHNVNRLRTVSTASHDKQVFWVARYILSVVDGNTAEKNHLIEIVRGFLISNALYFFARDNKTSITSKLSDVTCYLDCSLVISCLGYNTPERLQEITELISLIRTSGGKICVFEHTVTEAESLLDAFARMPDRINRFQLDGLAEKHYTSEILHVIASHVKENLWERWHIKTVAGPSYTNEYNYTGIQDEKGIAEWLENSRNLRHRNYIHRERFEFDAKSLSCIGMLRRTAHPQRIERCKAILVTQDPFLNSCMHHICPHTFPPEVDFSILDIDLASLLWLSQYNTKSTLPLDILISNAVALNLATDEIMERAIEITDQLVCSGDLTEDAALTIRSQPRMRQYIGEATENDKTAITHTNVQAALNRYIQDTTKEEISHNNQKWQRDYDTLHSQLIAEHQRTVKMQQEIQERMVLKCTNISEEHAAKAANLVKYGLLGLSIILLLIATVTLLTNAAQTILHKGATFVVALYSIAQIFDFTLNHDSLTKLLIRKVRDSVFSYCYAKELKHLSLFQDVEKEKSI